MIHQRRHIVTAIVLAAGLAGCYRPPSPVSSALPIRADNDARQECRQQVERQYNAQNRVDLTRRDERDQPFASTYNGGISSRGLGAQYHREQMETDCLRQSGDAGGNATPGVGPAFSPASSGAGTSSLRP